MAMMEEFDNSDATGFRDGLDEYHPRACFLNSLQVFLRLFLFGTERTGGVVVPLRYQHQLHADQGGSHTAGYMMRGEQQEPLVS